MSITKENITEKVTFKCDICQSVLSSKSSLTLHKKTTKYCLELQGKEPEKKFNCVSCLKKFNVKDNYLTHISKCETSPLAKNMENIKDRYEALLKDHNKLSKLYNKTIKRHIKDTEDVAKQFTKEKENYEKFITEFKTREFNYENRITELEARLENIAVQSVSKPTTVSHKTNTINNTVNNLQPIDYNEFKNESRHLTIQHVKKGTTGYAEFFLDNCIKDRYVCVDVNRRHIKYKNSDGIIIVDHECGTIVKKLCENILEKNNELIKELSDEIINEIQANNDSENISVIMERGNNLMTIANQVGATSRGERTQLYDGVVRELCSTK